MQLSRRYVFWIVLVLSIGLFAGSLSIYFLYGKKSDPYDAEVLTSVLHEEKPMTKETEAIHLPQAAVTTGDALQEDKSDKRVTACSSYSEKLVEEGSRNILILGEDARNKLYDTIGIVSVDSKNKKVAIIMLPRDMYVDYSKSVCDFLQAQGKANEVGIYKLNATHYIGAIIGYNGKFSSNSISFLAQVIKEKFSIEVDEYVKVNTDGFNQVVNLFGGVEVNVPYDMNYDDPTQDLSIHIAKGKQRLDGKRAEGFVRFRQGYKEDGTRFDVDRKSNQLAFLNAFIKQHGTVANVDKVPRLLKTLDRNIKHSLDVGDVLLTYIGLSKDIINGKYSIEDKNISGDKRTINGSYYEFVR
ncbi:MAG: LCP family protein [Clostridia bacterium]|nr:LCP family protein [Clostridia bacterium]